ncbi:MAG: UDP-N-acetylmuramoyl-L-alanine--D-glutamate ligase [Desulfitobacteriaceae bacterium]|nr:UDP-N-acetylmuramoyl-L-alanine--D-glutamate ligase [Clostridia bacterium]MDD4400767.1 UDP-N-acetylmuramoyl-L-alanine--D-glutamate ligase [Desulfitobacteriaceae bacterium]
MEGKRALVFGAGLSGQAAVRKLEYLGAEVFLTDQKKLSELSGIEELGLDPEHLLLGRIPEWQQVQPELLVLSPGVSPRNSLVAEALAAGIPVWSEVELAMRASSATCVAITGTNGKTTTTTLIGELAQRTGRPSIVAGNIGVALSGRIENLGKEGIIVAELSSFQLEFIDKFRANIGIFLNITPDHLDRHGSLENYLNAKMRIFENQTAEDLAILNWADPVVRGLGSRIKGRVIYFNPLGLLENGFGLRGEEIVYSEQGIVIPILSRQELQLRGSHNLENVLAAAAAAQELGLSWVEIARGLREFKGVKHRQENVGTYDGILFINDSKGTNPDAAAKAILAFAEPLVLIAGGRNKGLDFREFMKLVSKRVKSLILLGEAAEELAAAAREAGVLRLVRASSFAEGVEKAIAEAVPGDVVLLSPACTSWDMFKSYEERGELFKQLVRRHYKEPI